MKILVGLGHPAHFHLFKHFIQNLSVKGVEFVVVISEKDVLIKLLDNSGIAYYTIAKKSENETLIRKAAKVFRSTGQLNKIVSKEKPDILIGCLTQLAFTGFIKRKPVYLFGEDDIYYTYLQVLMMMPFIRKWIAPDITRAGIFSFKKLAYRGYQKLAYLHPNIFTPDRELIKNDVDLGTGYFLIRLVGLSAYHDQHIKGIDDRVMHNLIRILSPHGKIYITSEREMPEWLEKYRLCSNPSLIHHVMAHAKIFIGDSQSMAVEAAMLGVPSIRFNDFAGRISLLEELESKYSLTHSIPTSEPEKLYSLIHELIANNKLKEIFRERQQKMLADKIDVTAFWGWLFESYPEHMKMFMENPEIQNQFK